MAGIGFEVRLQAEPIRSLAYSAIDSTYMGIGTAMTRPIRALYLLNSTDAAIVFSFDGIEDNLILPFNGYFMFDICANKTVQQGWYLAEGTRVYAKYLEVPPTSGSVYLTTFYGSAS